ncbi:HNH endonuclease [Leifsonia poae]|uniref:HNH endonuclease n=1 Tax=Leifsonia poae TaxID=110933 RepID=UPI003D680C21
MEVQQRIVYELGRRRDLWEQVLALPEVDSSAVRRLGLYAGQAGIYRDAANSKAQLGGDGLALSLRHNGASYNDDLSDDGLIYHYPLTKRIGRHDEAEVASAKAAYEHSMPLFVILGSKDSRSRTLRLAYIQDFDDEARIFLVVFIDEVASSEPVDEVNFSLFESRDDRGLAIIRKRPNQQRFKFEVLRMYGAGCAVCGVREPALITAAHIVPKKAKGADDPRNGLPLCANHHLAFDAGLWRIAPGNYRVVTPERTTLEDLQITRADLSHLPQLPHEEGLAWSWKRGFKKV